MRTFCISAATAIAVAATAPVSAQGIPKTATCDTLDINLSLGIRTALETARAEPIAFPIGGSLGLVSADLSAGDTVLISSSEPAPMRVSISNILEGVAPRVGAPDSVRYQCFGPECQNASFTIPEDGTYQIVASLGDVFAVPGDLSRTDVAPDPVTASVTCRPGAVPGDGGASATATLGSVQSGISGATGARGGDGSGVEATRGGMFAFAEFENSGLLAWLNITGSTFMGTTEGDGVELTFGLDTQLANGVILGGVLSFGQFETTTGGNTLTSTALSYGPYVSYALSDRYDVTASLLYARPEYEAAGGDFTSDRVSAFLEASATYALGPVVANSYVDASGYREFMPATAPGGEQVHSRGTLGVGSRLDLITNGPAVPWLLIGLDGSVHDDGTTVTRAATGRYGLGVDVLTAQGGTLAFSLDYRTVGVETQALSYGVSFDLRF